MRYVHIIICCLTLISPLPSVAQSTVHEELKETVPAEVLAVTETRTREVPGTGTNVSVQDITVELLGGEAAGAIKSFENELAELEVGDRIFVNRIVTIQGDESYILMDVDRRLDLVLLGAFAIATILFFARWQGARALFSLALSVAAIIFLLIPALLHGWNPALASLLIAGIILALVLFLTHGINPRSLTAFAGTWSAVVITCGIAYVSVTTMSLSGFSSDAAVFLNFATQGSLDFAGLLLGSIIIGILGVLDDVSITQASVVQELKAANPKLTVSELYQRALNVGRDHVGSLVNTLALAYVGVSLPLILLYARADTSLMITINQEVVAAELVRIIIGSIGLVLAVPLTTVMAAWYFGNQTNVTADDIGHHCGHHH